MVIRLRSSSCYSSYRTGPRLASASSANDFNYGTACNSMKRARSSPPIVYFGTGLVSETTNNSTDTSELVLIAITASVVPPHIVQEQFLLPLPLLRPPANETERNDPRKLISLSRAF